MKFNMYIVGKILFLALLSVSCASTRAPKTLNSIATVQLKEPVAGVCDNTKVLMLSPMFGAGQVAAVCSLSKEQIQAKLDSDIMFLKDKSTLETKGMLSIIINCKGEMVQCKIDNETSSPELDAEILAVYKTLTTWTVGTNNGVPTDSIKLVSFTVKDGRVILN